MKPTTTSRARAINDLRRFSRAARDAAEAIRDLQDAMSTLAGQLSFGIIDTTAFEEEDDEESDDGEDME